MLRITPLVLVLALCLVPVSGAFSQRANPLVPQDLLVALDGREDYGPDLEVLEAALQDGDPSRARLGIRGLSRRHSPRFVGMIAPFLSDTRDGVAREAAFALGQLGQDSLYATLAARALLDGKATIHPTAIGGAARALGRLQFKDTTLSREIGRQLIHWLGDSLPTATMVDVVRGAEAYLRLAGRNIERDSQLIAHLENLSLPSRGVDDHPDLLRIRRAAAAALARSAPVDSMVLDALARDSDPEVRRQAMRWAAGIQAARHRAAIVQSGLGHPEPMVRIEALKTWAKFPDIRCSMVAPLIDDPITSVALEALDALRPDCGKDKEIVKRLRALATEEPIPTGGRLALWHRPAHALVALARIDAAAARPLIRAAKRSEIWQVRLYLAHAATAAREVPTLLSLASADSSFNVREAAATGLVSIQGHKADSVLFSALGTTDYQLVRTAAVNLQRSPLKRSIAPKAFSALQRITRDRSETSRDTRLALLDRIEEFGDATWAWRLNSYLQDFDPVIAGRAAAIITKMTGKAATAMPTRLPVVPLSSAALDSLRGARLKVTMSPESGGGDFEMTLFPEIAPATVLRVVAHARRGYYNGLTFHRVLSNFVIQGGSPGANEYSGDSRFLRDEIGFVSQERGTVGSSTRGLDTGDSQFYLNLVDNIRLDFDYTVWGRVSEGMEVVDGILEGDTIARIDVILAHGR